MDIDIDLTDIDDAPKQQQSSQPQRPSSSRFAPKSFKTKLTKPKTEPIVKQEPQQEQQRLQEFVKKKEEEESEDVKGLNGGVNMDVDQEEGGEGIKGNEEKVEEEGEEDDVVVREIDVFYNPSIDPNTQLYVLQYPLRPCWRPYDLDERCDEVRVKPGTAEVEVDLSVDIDSENFDSERAIEFNMTKQTLTTKWKPPEITGYAAGVLMGDKLHLNPIHAVVQLRPSMDHLKPGGLKRKTNATGNGEVVIKSEEGETKLAAPSKQQNKTVESSAGPKMDEECWVQLKYNGPESDFSTRYLKRMMAQQNSPIQFTMNLYDYVGSLCPGTNAKPRGPDRRLLLSMPLEERIEKLLREGPPFQRYSVIKYFAPDDFEEDVLKELQKHALLVQGFWVPKSSFLLANESQQLLLGRDYTLLLFSKNRIIKLSQINDNPPLVRIMTQFLKIFGRERQCFGDWIFRQPTDTSFLISHPNIVEEQNQKWDCIERNVKESINANRKTARRGPPLKNPVVESATNKMAENSVKSDKGTGKNMIGNLSGSKTMTKETREALPKALQKLFQIHKVCSYQLICEGLRNLATSQHSLPKGDASLVSAAEAVNSSDQLKSVIDEIAFNINGLYVLKSSTEHPELDPLRRVVMDLFRVNGRNSKLTKTEVFGAAKVALKREITNNEYTKVMKELCESRGSTWELKSGNGSVTNQNHLL